MGQPRSFLSQRVPPENTGLDSHKPAEQNAGHVNIGTKPRAIHLAEQLDVLAIDRGMPKALRMDNGPELISNAVAEWASETDRVFISPGQPRRDGYIESFNEKLRNECLSVNQFYLLHHDKGIIGIRKEEDNTIRSHSSLGCSTPSVYAGQCIH